MANTVSFGLHVGNTGMCLSMYKVRRGSCDRIPTYVGNQACQFRKVVGAAALPIILLASGIRPSALSVPDRVQELLTDRPTIFHSQDGNVNVIANDIGDRITPAILSVMHAEETLVGVPAKSNIVRNRSATVANNKQFFEPNLSESDFDDYSTNW